MKATVTVMLKPGVLDPQGKAIGHALHTLGFSAVGEVRVTEGFDTVTTTPGAAPGRP